jgi:hypothetical protein
MLPMEKLVTFTGACANEIILNGKLARLLTKRKKEVMLEYGIMITNKENTTKMFKVTILTDTCTAIQLIFMTTK